MNVTDPIADMLTRIRNAQKVRHEVVVVPASKLKIAVVHVLKEEGFVRAYKCVRDGKQGLIKIALKYRESDGAPTIQNIERISRPSRRVYVGVDKIPFVKNGFGLGILSTSQGITSCREARKKRIGGELLCSIY